jgi:hypothetical protein
MRQSDSLYGGVITKSGVLASESCGGQITLRRLNTVFKLYSNYHLGQAIEAARRGTKHGKFLNIALRDEQGSGYEAEGLARSSARGKRDHLNSILLRAQ